MNQAAPKKGLDPLLRMAIVITMLLFAMRIVLGETIGFGDAEALYAVYGIFGQATYLDHPALIGWLGSFLADADGAVNPVVVHRFTTGLATAIPWIGGLASRAAGAPWKGAMLTVIALAIVPEFAIGLFAFSPDLPLGVFWLGALGLACLALKTPPSSTKGFAATLGAGLCTGLACASKASGILLAAALIATWLAPQIRNRFKTFAPYAAILLGLLVTLPMMMREASLGWPMLHHRFMHTQIGFGPSLRNLGGLLGGQLLYLTPVIAFVVVKLAIDLARSDRNDPIDRLLFNATIPPFAVLATLTILSRVAEPHWVAPAYLGLALHLARRPRALLSRKVAFASVTTSLIAIALVFVVVRFPILPRTLGKVYEPKYDLVNDLFAWQPGAELVQQSLLQLHHDDFDPPTVVGPHWIICAQVQAALGRKFKVGCETPEGDDFQQLYPRSRWEQDSVLLYVTDDRFDIDLAERFPNRMVQGVNRVGVRRGGVLVRTIRVIQLGIQGVGTAKTDR